MITHYLKVAVRNLLKYKTQSIVSVLGLAIGFASVALSIYWNHYEMTYDAFQKNADRIYRVRQTSSFGGVSGITPGPLAEYLMHTHPEVEAACGNCICSLRMAGHGAENSTAGRDDDDERVWVQQ